MSSNGSIGGFVYKRRWTFAVSAAALLNFVYTNVLLVVGALSRIPVGEFVMALKGPSFLIFSILPFSDTYYARLVSAFPSPGHALIFIHGHAFTLFTSALFLLFILFRIKDFTRYVVDGKKHAEKNLDWMHYCTAVRMSILGLCALVGVFLSTTVNVSNPDLVMDGIRVSAVSAPFLVFWATCAVIIFRLSRDRGREDVA